MFHGQTYQEKISPILITPSISIMPFYEAHQAPHFMKQARQAHHFKKHAIFWRMPSMPYCEARQARHFMKHNKHVSTPSSKSTLTRQAREHVKHGSTLSTWPRQIRKARKTRERASTLFSGLLFIGNNNLTRERLILSRKEFNFLKLTQVLSFTSRKFLFFP